MLFTEEQIEIAKRVSRGAEIYRKNNLRDGIHRNQFKDSYDALVRFIQGYAYERTVTVKAYKDIAEESIKRLSGRTGLITLEDSEEIWREYTRIFETEYTNLRKRSNTIANERINPLNFGKGKDDKKVSILTMIANNQIENLAVFVKDMIQDRKTKEIHKLLMRVRGIGVKIASLYMRDIAFLGGLNEREIEDPHYLQPIDTWVEQALEIIFKNVPKKTEEKQKMIVELCNEVGVSPIAFNQGAWVIGNQIAGGYLSLREILEGETKPIERYMSRLSDISTFLRQIK